MAIREATVEDLPALMPLLRGYCDFYESNPSDESLERMARRALKVPEDVAFLLVAVDDRSDEVVGFAHSQWKWSSLSGTPVAVIDDLFVAEIARGAGHADALIEAVAAVARRLGAASIFWYTTPDNKRAHKVYDRVGGRSETLLEYELEL